MHTKDEKYIHVLHTNSDKDLIIHRTQLYSLNLYVLSNVNLLFFELIR